MARRPHFLAPLIDAAPGGMHLLAAGLPAPVATLVSGAFDSASRTRGLLGRSSLPEGEALVIAPCSSVHTFGMRFAIDLAYVNRDGRVIKVRQAMPPSRMSAAWGAFAVVELPAGTIARTGLGVGDILTVTQASASI